jgi:uncharacterized Rmd1/YagE family protein
MTQNIFENLRSVNARAFLVGQNIRLKELYKGGDVLGTSPLIVRAGREGFAALFRYGMVVLFNQQPVEELAFLENLKPLIDEAFEKPEFEDARITIDPARSVQAIEQNQMFLQTCGIEHLQIVAIVLAKSAYLAYYEAEVARIFDLVDPMAAELQKEGHTGRKTQDLLRHIGQALLIQSRVIGRLEITDKPELVWDRPDLDRLYIMLVEEYELRDRVAIMKQKLNLIHETADTLLSFIQNQSTHRVEWYIVILIVFDILMGLVEKLLGF